MKAAAQFDGLADGDADLGLTNGRVLSFLISILLMVGGVVSLYYGITLCHRSIESNRWPSVPGQIVRTQIAYAHHSRTPQYSATFSYTVDGRQYLSRHYSVGSERISEDRYEEFGTDERNGISVPVYYDPHDPGEGVLRRGITPNPVVALVGGVILLLAGVLLLRTKGRGFEPVNRREKKSPAYYKTVGALYLLLFFGIPIFEACLVLGWASKPSIRYLWQPIIMVVFGLSLWPKFRKSLRKGQK